MESLNPSSPISINTSSKASSVSIGKNAVTTSHIKSGRQYVVLDEKSGTLGLTTDSKRATPRKLIDQFIAKQKANQSSNSEAPKSILKHQVSSASSSDKLGSLMQKIKDLFKSVGFKKHAQAAAYKESETKPGKANDYQARIKTNLSDRYRERLEKDKPAAKPEKHTTAGGTEMTVDGANREKRLAVSKRNPDDASAGEQLASQAKKEGRQLPASPAVDAKGKIKLPYDANSVTFKTLAGVGRARLDDVKYAGTNTLTDMFKADKVNLGFKNENVTFVRNELENFLSQANIAKDGSNIQQLKEQFRQVLMKQIEQHQTIDRATFANLVAAHHGQIPPSDVMNAPQLEALQKALKDGTWPENEERPITLTKVHPNQQQQVIETALKLFDDPDFKTFLTHL